jgi:hypothetical protein
MIPPIILTVAILIPSIVLVGPLLAFVFGRWRAGQRSEAVLRYFDAEQRPVIASYYKVMGIVLAALILGGALCYWIDGSAMALLVVLLIVAPAATFLLVLGWFGLSLIGFFISAATETVPGCCSRCDYDLRGIENGRCPECGHVVGVQMAES